MVLVLFELLINNIGNYGGAGSENNEKIGAGI